MADEYLTYLWQQPGSTGACSVSLRFDCCRLCVQIELHDMSSSFYISTGSTPVVAYGATFPKLGNNQVKILSLNRFDCFRELLLESGEFSIHVYARFSFICVIDIFPFMC